MTRQLNLDRDKLDQCYALAAQIVAHAYKFIQRHSSPAVERATLLLLGVEENYRGTPFATLLVEKLTKDQQRLGAAYWWGRAVLGTKEDPRKIAELLAKGKMKWVDLPDVPPAQIKKETKRWAETSFKKLDEGRRGVFPFSFSSFGFPVLIHFQESRPKKIRAFLSDWMGEKKGLGVIAFRSKKHFEETWLEEEIQEAWKAVREKGGIPVTEGLSLPEQTVLALRMGFNTLLLDGWTPALHRKIDVGRALIDHDFALSLCAKWGVQMISGHSQRMENQKGWKTPSLLAGLLLYEQAAKKVGIPFENMILSFPQAEEGEKELLSQITLAQLLREMFSQSYLSLNFFNARNPFSFFTAALTEQDALEWIYREGDPLFHSPSHFWGVVEEKIHQVAGLQSEFSMNIHGRIAREAHSFLEQTWRLLRNVSQLNLWKALEKNIFSTEGEKGNALGKEGVFQKSYHYWNPLTDVLN